MATYTYFPKSPVCGTVNINMRETVIGIANHNNHGLAFPCLDLVLSTINPIMISLVPSRKRETIIIIPIIAAFNPNASV